MCVFLKWEKAHGHTQKKKNQEIFIIINVLLFLNSLYFWLQVHSNREYLWYTEFKNSGRIK